MRARERIAGVIARETGRSLASVLADIDRDRWMSAEEAIEYGLVSKVITQQGELPGYKIGGRPRAGESGGYAALLKPGLCYRLGRYGEGG